MLESRHFQLMLQMALSQCDEIPLNTYAPPAVLFCQSLESFIRFPMVAMPLYQLLIYAIGRRLRYVISAAWEIYFSYARLSIASVLRKLSRFYYKRP